MRRVRVELNSAQELVKTISISSSAPGLAAQTAIVLHNQGWRCR